ncbi:helix-turn-helix transcriptional regulator [Catenulispora sp. EB89]|uniref:helix-turn-helix transcriptional regulator n=1 Tax=Catenulispora sp. EB89 TaxID=3156257 RepID=UPI0035137CCC
MLQVDEAAKHAFMQVIGELRALRRDARISQTALSSRVGVRGGTISEWENLRLDPTLVHLTRWSGGLDRCLVVVGPDGKVLLPEPLWLLPGETGDSFELRRLAGPLKRRRQALKLNQKTFGRLVGVSGSAISYWELSVIPPRSVAQIVWAQKLGCSIALWPKDLVLRETIRALTEEWRPDSHPCQVAVRDRPQGTVPYRARG